MSDATAIPDSKPAGDTKKRIVARLDDVWRITAPLRTFGGALMSGRRSFDERIRERWPDRRRDAGADI